MYTLRCSYCLLTTQWLPSFYGNYEKDRRAYTIQPMCDSKIALRCSKWHKVLLRAVWNVQVWRLRKWCNQCGLVTRKYLCWIIMLGLMWTPLIANQKVYDKLLSSGVSLLRCFRTGICFFSHLGNTDQILLEFYLFVYHFNYFKHTNQQH